MGSGSVIEDETRLFRWIALIAEGGATEATAYLRRWGSTEAVVHVPWKGQQFIRIQGLLI